MLHFEIDPGRGSPAYRQIMDQVRYYVASGALGPGDRLPSIRELARYLRVNPSTVVKAFDELERDGAIEQQQGRGAFVRDSAQQIPRRERSRIIADSARRLAIEARQLGASDEDVLEALRRELARLGGSERAVDGAGDTRLDGPTGGERT